ncbi:hypothetical protein ES708_02512 [subsurface metagenome]
MNDRLFLPTMSMAQYLRKPGMKKYRLIMFDACVRERSAYNMDYTQGFTIEILKGCKSGTMFTSVVMPSVEV